jgi:ribonucleoside-diphosphate reductase alpha chain
MTPPEDNIESIFDRAGKLARTYSYGGGCGIDISDLSPKGASINNAAKETSGSISFMTLYSLVTELIGQNGRRGALMISIDCSHPDVLDFIKLKTDLDKVTKANISVRISDDFMQAVKEHKPYMLHYTRKETQQTIENEINAAEMFHLIAETNWDFAEPGALFWDRISNWNLLSNTPEFKYAGVNPCAEEPLPAGGSCLLGSMNLAEFVKDPFTDHAAFDFDEFKRCVGIAVKALNDVLEEGLPLHPLEEQRKSVSEWRQIGLGHHGLSRYAH